MRKALNRMKAMYYKATKTRQKGQEDREDNLKGEILLCCHCRFEVFGWLFTQIEEIHPFPFCSYLYVVGGQVSTCLCK